MQLTIYVYQMQGLLLNADRRSSMQIDESEQVDGSVHEWLVSQFTEVNPKANQVRSSPEQRRRRRLSVISISGAYLAVIVLVAYYRTYDWHGPKFLMRILHVI